MIRISDIIKMNEAEKSEEKERPLIKETQKEDIPRITKELEANRAEDIKLYNRGITLIREVLDRVKKSERMFSEPIVDFIKMLVESILTEDSRLLSRFYETDPPVNYLPAHSINVSLMSTKLGMWLGLNKSDLMELAIAGFLHDLGMGKVERLVAKKGRLGSWDLKKVKRHPETSAQIIRDMKCLGEQGILAVRTHHEKGPRDKFSQVISLADIYEAMTHSRPYRRAKAPHQAVGEIIDKEALSFHSDVIKPFVNNIGIYPVGSWVRLSTGEIGVVIETNKGYPLRPKVNIMFNHSGERLRGAKVIDFISESHFYIDGPVDIADKEKLKTGWGTENRKENL